MLCVSFLTFLIFLTKFHEENHEPYFFATLLISLICLIRPLLAMVYLPRAFGGTKPSPYFLFNKP